MPLSELIVTGLSNSPPSVALSSPSDGGSTSDTTPDLVFTGTDQDSDTLEYQVQVDTVNTFDSSLGTISVGSSTGSVVSNGFTAGSKTVSFYHICVNRTSKLVVPVYIWQDVAGTGTVSSMTCGSVSMTKIGSYQHSGTTMSVEMWYLDNPPIGSNLITINVSGATDSVKASSISLLNTESGYSTTSTDGGNGTAAALSPSLTPSENNCIIIDALLSFGGTNAVQSYTSSFEDTTGSVNAATQYTIQTTATARTMAWSWTTAGDWSHFGVIFKSSSPLINTFSATDAGFSAGHPFSSSASVTYTVQSALSLTTYYWRVRGIDPSGTNTYGAWSSTRSFTVSAGGSTVVQDLIGGFGFIPFAR